MKHQFNLLHEPWIPVVTLDGVARSVSLREALLNATIYRGVSANLPHTNAAVLRLLLAVLHRNFGPPNTDVWETLWLRGAFDGAVLDEYFERWQSRFDLFSNEHPFYQNRHPLVREKPAQALMQMIGGGDTFTLFDHVLDESLVSLTPPEAALLLVTAQAFSLAGLAYPQLHLVYNDAPCSRAIVFFVEGKNLFETLMFNLIQYNRAEPFPWHAEEPDRPAWEADDPYLPQRSQPLGYLDYLTWPNRRIMLVPEEQSGQSVVVRITTAPGLVLNAEVHNPMHHYRIDAGKKAGEQTVKVLRFSEGRALWRDSHALLDLHSQAADVPRSISWMSQLVSDGVLPGRRLQLSAYGMCTEPGKAKVNFYRGQSFEFDDDLLHNTELVNTLGTALEHAENLRRELWSTTSRLAAQMIAFDADKESDRKPDSKDVQNLVQHWNAEGLYWNRLEIPFHRFLDHLPENPAGALQTWHEELRAAVRAAYEQTVNGLGESQKALKAAATTRGWLAYGIKKVLDVRPQEE